MARVDPAVVTIKLEHSEGSGFILNPNGVILTNYHVIEGAKSATVILADKTSFSVEGFLAILPGKDIALVQIQAGAKQLQSLPLAEAPPNRGERVYAFGAPLGLQRSVSDGIIASLRSGEEVRDNFRQSVRGNVDVYRDLLGYEVDAQWVQTTSPISPGNSGGPLVNVHGQVIAINTWCRAQGQNVNFAISISHVKQLAAMARSVQPLASLPAPRAGLVALMKGDGKKSLDLWNRIGELKVNLKNRVQVCQAKLDKHRKPMDRANLQRGLNSRVASMSKDYSQLAGLYKKYAEELKSAENTDVDPDLLALSVVDVEVAQRTADAYEHYARAVQLDTTEHPIESELRLARPNRAKPTCVWRTTFSASGLAASMKWNSRPWTQRGKRPSLRKKNRPNHPRRHIRTLQTVPPWRIFPPRRSTR